NQHRVDIRAGEDFAKVVIREHRVRVRLSKLLRIHLIAPLLGALPALFANIANSKDLHVLPRDIAAGHVRPGAAQPMAGPLSTQSDESHRDSLAGRHRAVAPERGSGNEPGRRKGRGRADGALKETAARRDQGMMERVVFHDRRYSCGTNLSLKDSA